MMSKIFTTVKYTLVTINLLFLLTGVIVLTVGSTAKTAFHGYDLFLTNNFFSLASFCIATGIIIFIITFLGFFGAFKENYYLIMAYAGLMVIMLIFQLSACIAGYVLKDNAVAFVEQSMRDSMKYYNITNIDVAKTWDDVQTSYECCGVRSADDWLLPLSTNVTKALPISCCKREYGTVGELHCNVSNAFTNSCLTAFGLWVQDYAASIGIAGIILVIMQVLVLAGAFWMAKISREEHGYP